MRTLQRIARSLRLLLSFLFGITTTYAQLEGVTSLYINTRTGVVMETLTYTFSNFRQQQRSEGFNHDMFEGSNR